MVGIRLRSKVGEKGQVVIPQPIRDSFGIKPFTEVFFNVEGGKIAIEKKSSEDWLKGFGYGIKKIKLPKKIDWDNEYYSQFD